jgi:hypothetical protein
MARKTFVLGIFVMASALGVLGYQCLTYFFYGAWPSVSVGFVWRTLFSYEPILRWSWMKSLAQWISNLPVVGFGIGISYAILLLSDCMRGRTGRPLR